MNTISSFGTKVHHVLQFAKFCFSERGYFLGEARELTKLGINAFSFIPGSTRKDLYVDHIGPFLAHVNAIYFSTLSHHEAIQTLCLSGHSLNSMIVLRTQLEAVLLFLHVTEPQEDLEEVHRRTDLYRDWVAVRMKQNTDRSLKFAVVKKVLTDDFLKLVNDNYIIVQGKHIDSPSQFTKLQAANSFLTSRQRESLASRFDIEDLYHHIFAESSASIHFADIGNRITEIGPRSYRYRLREKHGALWPIMLSNLLQLRCIQQFGIFFGIKEPIDKRLREIFHKDKTGNAT